MAILNDELLQELVDKEAKCVMQKLEAPTAMSIQSEKKPGKRCVCLNLKDLNKFIIITMPGNSATLDKATQNFAGSEY